MIRVRPAERADARLLLELLHEMAQQEQLAIDATEERLLEDGFGPTPKFGAYIAEVDGTAAGYALFFDCYSSFRGRGLFLEDLYVRDDCRGLGLGKALLSSTAQRAVELGCFGVMFNVLDWNETALRFFEGAGATPLTSRKTLCLEGLALADVARHHPPG